MNPLAAILGERPSRSTWRRGLSLIELLAATLISLIIMAATVTLFGVVGEKINNGRAAIELSDRLRGALHTLRTDLRGLTCETVTWQAPARAAGYLELDKSPPLPANQNANGLLGYTGDILCFTTRSKGLPFVARAIVNGQTQMIESTTAEVQWFLWQTLDAKGNPVTNPPTYDLYRHMVLVRPDFGTIPINQYINFDTASAGTLNYDLSAHQDSKTGNFVCNNLTDLAYREFRFNHVPGFPFSLYPGFPRPVPTNDPRYGEDVVLSNVLSFDVKVWDPQVQVRQDTTGTPLVPSDPGYANGTPIPIPNTNPVQYVSGAYVDLNYNGNANQTYFSGPYYGSGQKSSVTGGPIGQGIYDTWCSGYETYTTGPGAVGQATNGEDNDGQNGVDDPGERLTSPPYPVPLRGLQIKIRVYEPSSRQVREATLCETFVPD